MAVATPLAAAMAFAPLPAAQFDPSTDASVLAIANAMALANASARACAASTRRLLVTGELL